MFARVILIVFRVFGNKTKYIWARNLFEDEFYHVMLSSNVREVSSRSFVEFTLFESLLATLLPCDEERCLVQFLSLSNKQLEKQNIFFQYCATQEFKFGFWYKVGNTGNVYEGKDFICKQSDSKIISD